VQSAAAATDARSGGAVCAQDEAKVPRIARGVAENERSDTSEAAEELCLNAIHRTRRTPRRRRRRRRCHRSTITGRTTRVVVVGISPRLSAQRPSVRKRNAKRLTFQSRITQKRRQLRRVEHYMPQPPSLTRRARQPPLQRVQRREQEGMRTALYIARDE
jgi:hypothetical protein